MRFPEPPAWLPDDQYAEGEYSFRYEDISQTGALRVTAIPPAHDAVWSQRIMRHPALAARSQGVLPILSRLYMESTGGPLGVGRVLRSRGCYQLAHTVDGDGAVERIVLNVWGWVFGKAGRTNAPPPPNAGEWIEAGRVYSEYVFTRPFAPAGERRVTRLEVDGTTIVPIDRHEWRPFADLAVLPEGAEALDGSWVDDGIPTVFGADHTDSNQHVNSLAYPRLFIESGLRRLASRGRSGLLQARRVALGFRKPCFAGEVVRVMSRSFATDAGVGAVGRLMPFDADPPTKPSCYAQVIFSEG
jgi:hypothetical protein